MPLLFPPFRRNVVFIAELDFDGTTRHFKIHYHPGIRIGYDIVLGVTFTAETQVPSIGPTA